MIKVVDKDPTISYNRQSESSKWRWNKIQMESERFVGKAYLRDRKI